jgi:hypothetical protein
MTMDVNKTPRFDTILSAFGLIGIVKIGGNARVSGSSSYLSKVYAEIFLKEAL